MKSGKNSAEKEGKCHQDEYFGLARLLAGMAFWSHARAAVMAPSRLDAGLHPCGTIQHLQDCKFVQNSFSL